MFETFTEFHSSGTVRDLHPIPFSFPPRHGERKTKSGANITVNPEKQRSTTNYFRETALQTPETTIFVSWIFHFDIPQKTIALHCPWLTISPGSLPQLRLQLGMSAVRIRCRSISLAIYVSIDYRDEDHSCRTARSDVGSRPADPPRTAAARTAAARNGTQVRRTMSAPASTAPKEPAPAPKRNPAATPNWYVHRSKPADSTSHTQPPNSSASN